MEILEAVIHQLTPREVKEFKHQIGGGETGDGEKQQGGL